MCFAVVSGYVSRVTASGVAGSADGASTVGESGAGATCSEGERAERADTLLIAVVGGAGNGGPNTVGPRRHGAQQAADAKFSNALSIPTGIDLISLTTKRDRVEVRQQRCWYEILAANRVHRLTMVRGPRA